MSAKTTITILSVMSAALSANAVAEKKAELEIIPGKGIKGVVSIGDDVGAFVKHVGARNLVSQDANTSLSIATGPLVVYRDKKERWMVLASKKTRKILQVFYCGGDWATGNGFGPKQPYSRFRDSFGPTACASYALEDHAENGIGFWRERTIKEADSDGVTRLGKTYDCVTVFQPDEMCEKHTDPYLQ